MTDWGALATMLLTPRGLLNGDFESFRPIFWAAVETVTVAFDARSLSFGTENLAFAVSASLSFWRHEVTKKPRELSLMAFCVEWNAL